MRAAVLMLLAVLPACAHVPAWAGGHRDAPVERLYHAALMHMDTVDKAPALDSAVFYLDRYMASSRRLDHAQEAAVLRRLAVDAIQLRRVEASLRQARESERRTETRDGDVERRPAEGDASVKEIQRLKDELAKANAELERIRKRLANPREPLN